MILLSEKHFGVRVGRGREECLGFPISCTFLDCGTIIFILLFQGGWARVGAGRGQAWEVENQSNLVRFQARLGRG